MQKLANPEITTTITYSIVGSNILIEFTDTLGNSKECLIAFEHDPKEPMTEKKMREIVATL